MEEYPIAMSDYHYFDIKLNLRDPDSVVLTPSFFRSCVLNALDSYFCEERPVLEIVKFCALQKRIIFRVPEELSEMTRISIGLIAHYQETPCNIEVLEMSKTPLDFEKVCEKDAAEVKND